MSKVFEVTDLPIAQIIVADRARKDLGDLEELKKSISQHGLLQPILVGSDYRLIAGERRLTACKELEHSTIVARIMPSNISAEDLMIIEMMENVARKEFNWHELVELKYKIHKTLQQAAAPAQWGYRDTANKLECSIGLISSDLALAEGIQVFPQLRDMPTKAKARDAYKKLCQRASDIQATDALSEDERTRLQMLMNGTLDPSQYEPTKKKEQDLLCATHDDCQPVGLSDPGVSQGEPPLEEQTNSDKPKASYVIKPCLELLSELPDQSVGLIELDPPYAIDYNTNYEGSNKTKLAETDWTVDRLFEFYQSAFAQMYRVLYPDAWVLIWTGKEHWLRINQLAEAAGFGTQHPGIWSKKSGSSNSPKSLLVSTYETFLLFRKGRATFNLDSFPNVIEYLTVPPSQRTHQWEKPVELYRYFVRQLGRPDAIFLSLFTGSGNSLIAAAQEDMRPIGCDTSQKYIHSFYRKFDNFFI